LAGGAWAAAAAPFAPFAGGAWLPVVLSAADWLAADWAWFAEFCAVVSPDFLLQPLSSSARPRMTEGNERRRVYILPLLSDKYYDAGAKPYA